MFCSQCGAPLGDDARFCAQCGTPVAKPQPQPEEIPEEIIVTAPSVTEEPVIEEPVTKKPQKEKVKKEKKPRKPIGALLARIAIAVVALVLLVAICLTCVLLFPSVKKDQGSITAYIDPDGTVYVPYGKGKLVKLTGEAVAAQMTHDNRRVVVAENYGRIYFYDVRSEKKHDIFADSSKNTSAELERVTNDFVVYSVEKTTEDQEITTLMRYSFKEKAAVEIWEERIPLQQQVASSLNIRPLATEVPVGSEEEATTVVPDGEEPENENNNGTGFETDENGALVIPNPDNGGSTNTPVDPDTLEVDEFIVSESAYCDEVAVLFVQGEKIMLLTADSKDPVQAGSFDAESETVNLLGVADDGSSAAWYTSQDQKSFRIYLYAEGEAECVATVTLDDADTSFDCTCSVSPRKGKLMMITAEKKLILRLDGEVSTVNLPGPADGDNVMTTNGEYIEYDEKAASAYGLYLPLRDGQQRSLYLVALREDSREKLVTNYQAFFVRNDLLLWLDENNVTYCAYVNAKKGTMDEKQRISSDAFNIQVARGNTQYVYYIKNYSGSLGTGDLFVYNVKENESDKIASDVSLEFHVSTCGKYVYYYENPNTVTTANGSVTYGLLKEYSLKKEKAVKLGNDVVLNSLTSYNRNREILRNNCWFNTYQSTTKDSYTVNICYYSGKKPEAVVKEYEA